MSAAPDHARAARAALAAIGADLRAAEGSPGERRAAALLAAVNGREPPAASLPELIDAPAWLHAPRDTQRRIATAAALLSMGPTLATSIDGAWLGRLAERAGEALLDWAIARADELPGGDDTVPLAADELAAAGFALLRAELPASLWRFLAWAPGGVAAKRDAAAVALAPDAPGPGVAVADWERVAEGEAARDVAEAA